MPHKRDSLERQLTAAREDLETWNEQLDKQGVEAASRRRDPRWRKLNATCRQLTGRLNAAAAIQQRDAEAAERKAENVSSKSE